MLLLGAGGREHALGRSLAADPAVGHLHIAPGNPGLSALGTRHLIDPADPAAVVALARELGVELVVIGPEAPLVAGVADALREAGIDCFGPSREAAVLEGSKAFAKEVMAAAGVPTAESRVCDTVEQTTEAIDEFGPTHVVKNDGLAAGKGVVVTDDRETAIAHAASCGRVVIEAFLDGPEVSLFVICDGERGLPLLPAQDFKRVGDGDAGPNTGGMGAYAPLPWAPEGLVDEVMERVVAPTLAEMRRRGTPFIGLLYVGLALTTRSGMQVVEFNVRFGDPETQAVLALLRTPLAGVLRAAARGELDTVGDLEWDTGSAVVVVEAASGYPGTPRTGCPIHLPADSPEAWALQAGTAEVDGQLVSTGGRVLGMVGVGVDLETARAHAYAKLAEVDFADGFHRTDIGIPH
ncbi:phosphoribosylamine--glycine ligase [Tessaracoccus antarcticus]|uniref:Phosphoribosylamine--glycine ligase n=1 Tax=Tessaracoccus antarcticus TaxID=2479848 RepID=A0A3M0G7T1_9ACTN|nr:phosphoribosylamine--glycine ligase [Tessaracoccus antarcticus]